MAKKKNTNERDMDCDEFPITKKYCDDCGLETLAGIYVERDLQGIGTGRVWVCRDCRIARIKKYVIATTMIFIVGIVIIATI